MASGGAEGAASGGGAMFLIIAIIGFLPWPFFIGYGLMKLKAKLAAMAAEAADSADDGAGEEDEDDGAGDEDAGALDGGDADQIIQDFLDQGCAPRARPHEPRGWPSLLPSAIRQRPGCALAARCSRRAPHRTAVCMLVTCS